MNLTIEAPDLTSYQKEILYNEKRFTVTEASTKVGKTFSHIWWLFENAMSSDNQQGYNHWWVAPVYAQAKIAFNRMKSVVQKSRLFKINESNLTITTPKGVVMHFKSADKPDNLFGEDVYSAVFDEAPRAKKEAWYALRSTLTATNAKCKLIGNFGGLANWMHQLKEKAKGKDSEYAYYKITAWDAVKEGILSEEEILQAQKDLPPKVFKQLYLAEEQESEDMLCTYDSINNLFTNEFVKKGNRYITADIALHGSDKFVLIVWEGFRVIGFYTIDKCNAKEVTQFIKDKANKYRVGHSNIVYDSDGLGSFLRGFLPGAKPFNNGSKPIREKKYASLKDQCGYLLSRVINANAMFFECNVDKESIIQELECLQSYDMDKDGKLKILPKAKVKEIIGRSPDLLDAMLMRMYFELFNTNWQYKSGIR